MQGLEETKKACMAEGVKEENINIFICDVSQEEQIKEGGSKARAAFGEVTILINNAGVVSGRKIDDIDERMVNRTMAVNTNAHIYAAKEFLPGMIKVKRGHIVSISSMAGIQGVNGLVDYSASKYGAVGVDEALRLELKKLGYDYIKTTCICPYFINTGMFDGAK